MLPLKPSLKAILRIGSFEHELPVLLASLMQLLSHVFCFSFVTPTYCSLPGSSVHGILQTRILEWVAIPFFRGPSHLRGQTRVSQADCRQILNCLSRQGIPYNLVDLLLLFNAQIFILPFFLKITF